MSSAATREDRLAAIHTQLLEQVAKLTSSQQWRAMLTVAARFHSYSPNNVLLIAAQQPDATRVAGYRAWAQLGRQVRKGESGIAILAPVLRRREPGAADVVAKAPPPVTDKQASDACRVPGHPRVRRPSDRRPRPA
jgi:hypothetical protein